MLLTPKHNWWVTVGCCSYFITKSPTSNNTLHPDMLWFYVCTCFLFDLESIWQWFDFVPA